MVHRACYGDKAWCDRSRKICVLQGTCNHANGSQDFFSSKKARRRSMGTGFFSPQASSPTLKLQSNAAAQQQDGATLSPTADWHVSGVMASLHLDAVWKPSILKPFFKLASRSGSWGFQPARSLPGAGRAKVFPPWIPNLLWACGVSPLEVILQNIIRIYPWESCSFSSEIRRFKSPGPSFLAGRNWTSEGNIFSSRVMDHHYMAFLRAYSPPKLATAVLFKFRWLE